MAVAIIPKTLNTSTVYVNGKDHGTLVLVEAPGPFEGLDGQTHTGRRWLPEGVRPDLSPGPVTAGHAALLALALAGEDVVKIAPNLLGITGKGKAKR